VHDNSDYISRTLEGNDESGNLPIYRYHLVPEETTFNSSLDYKKKPKIIIIAGEHGDETGGDPNTSIYALYYFIEALCNDWEDNEVLEYLRWNVEFVINPVANPYGINNKQKYNSNDVDINRNWDNNWNNYAGEEKGPSPFSEKETNYVKNMIESNRDAIAYLNLHTIGGVSYVEDFKLLRYVCNRTDVGFQVCNNTSKRMSRKWKDGH